MSLFVPKPVQLFSAIRVGLEGRGRLQKAT